MCWRCKKRPVGHKILNEQHTVLGELCQDCHAAFMYWVEGRDFRSRS